MPDGGRAARLIRERAAHPGIHEAKLGLAGLTFVAILFITRLVRKSRESDAFFSITT